MATLFWLIVILGVCLTLAYRRVDLKISTVAVGAVVVAYSVLGESAFWAVVLWVVFAPLAALNVESLRREYLTQPLLDIFRTMVPSLSRTERDALESGSVWWEGELFSGIPDWSKLTQLPAPKLTDDEQAFLDGPTEALCRMLDDWEVTHELLDMPEKVWAYIKQERFFAIIIPA